MNNNESSKKEKENEDRKKIIVLQKQNKNLIESIGHMIVQSKISHLNHSAVLGAPNGLFSLFPYLLHPFGFAIYILASACLHTTGSMQSPTLFASMLD
jgi:hypothetical protein